MSLFSLEDVEQAARQVYQVMPPTPQYCWPQLSNRIGANVWVKHENHTPTTAFKVRGGITYIQWLKQTDPDIKGIVTATRGNHGQSQARAASAAGLKAKIVVPFGNAHEKNTAMKSFGADLIEFGKDFDEARIEARRIAKEEGYRQVPAFDRELAVGVATYGMELFTRVKNLDAVYVPIGCGSGICSLIVLRDLLGLSTDIIGVVSTEAPAAKLSFDKGRIVSTETANTLADGMAVRQPVEQAFDIYSKGASRIIAVSDGEVADAMRLFFATTHNVAEGAGAAALAGLQQEKNLMHKKNVAVILCGGNVDTDIFQQVLAGKTPVID